jgi:hypothetical protein
MDSEELLEELEKLARRMGVEIRQEYTGGRVGRCLLNGVVVIVVDAGFRVRDRAEALAMALADLDTEPHFLPEAARDFLDRHRQAPRLPFTDRAAAAGASRPYTG